MFDLYATLGVEKSAAPDELKRAYRDLAKKYHPDLHPGDKAAEAKFQQISEAYETLGDPEKRKKYDAEQARPGPSDKTKKAAHPAWSAGPPDVEQMAKGFESFFGFDPATGEVTNEEKLKKKNPLDVSGLFEKYMGFK